MSAAKKMTFLIFNFLPLKFITMTNKQKTSAGIICLIITMISPVFLFSDADGFGTFLFICFILCFGTLADNLLTNE